MTDETGPATDTEAVEEAPPPHTHRRVCDTHDMTEADRCHCGEDHGAIELPCGPWCPENPEADPYT